MLDFTCLSILFIAATFWRETPQLTFILSPHLHLERIRGDRCQEAAFGNRKALGNEQLKTLWVFTGQ